MFCVEIFLSTVGFGIMYWCDKWNIADLIVIILTIILTVIDMVLTDANASNILRIRGIFRLLRVFMLLRRFDVIRKKTDARRKGISSIYDIQSPVEKV
jgi:hypothetical protein